MSKKMLINATHPEENRVAIVEDGILTELDIEIAGKEQTKGNIYKAAVVRIEPGLQAAFIDYGAERFGFLQMGELHPSYFRTTDGGEIKRPRISDVLKRGQELLVQVVKEERGTKGAALTTYLSLPGRYMVFMPDSDTKGVSRKIEDESQRKKLKEAMASLDLPSNMGYIVRTAGIGQKKEELKRDFDYLVRVYESIQEQARKVRAPALIYKESNLAIRSIRDYFSSDMDEVLIDDPKVADEAREFFQQVMPEYARLVKLHQERRPIFSRYQIEEQIETITKNKVQLPSGGSIVIDVTEALVAIDVNSGKMAGEQGVESTAYKTNLEAAAEAARQLRLRDLGGLIVLDFIDMRERKHIREVEKCLKDALKNDKARVTVGRISQFGLLEMSRQRIKAALAEGSFLPCPHCSGSGKIKSPEAQAVAFLRKVQAAVAKGQIGRLEGEIPLDVATYLLNYKREELLDMERRHQLVLIIKGRPELMAGQANLSVFKREKEEIVTEAEKPLLIERSPQIAPLAPLAPFAAPASFPLPVPPEAEETAAPPPSEMSMEPATEEIGKKRKRRRRKRKKTEEGAGDSLAAAELEGAESMEEGEEDEEEPAESVDSVTEDALGGENPPPAEERRRKRRRRRRKKTSIAAEETEGDDVSGAVMANNQPILPVDEPEAESPLFPAMANNGPFPSSEEREAEEVLPSVMANSVPIASPRVKAEEASASPPLVNSEPIVAPAEPLAQKEESTASDDKPKSRRRSRPKAGAEGAPTLPDTSAAEIVPSTSPQPSPATDDAPPPPRKRRSPRRKRPASPPVSDGSPETAPPPDAAEAEARPKRQPARRRKEGDGAEAPASNEAKPKRKTSRSRTAEPPSES